MLKTTILFQVLVVNKVLAVSEIDGIKNNKSTQKFVESKTRKLSKSQKLAKFKKLLKCGNSPNFSAKKSGLTFLTSSTRKTFNCLWLAFTKALILWYFDLEYPI